MEIRRQRSQYIQDCMQDCSVDKLPNNNSAWRFHRARISFHIPPHCPPTNCRSSRPWTWTSSSWRTLYLNNRELRWAIAAARQRSAGMATNRLRSHLLSVTAKYARELARFSDRTNGGHDSPDNRVTASRRSRYEKHRKAPRIWMRVLFVQVSARRKGGNGGREESQTKALWTWTSRRRRDAANAVDRDRDRGASFHVNYWRWLDCSSLAPVKQDFALHQREKPGFLSDLHSCPREGNAIFQIFINMTCTDWLPL